MLSRRGGDGRCGGRRCGGWRGRRRPCLPYLSPAPAFTPAFTPCATWQLERDGVKQIVAVLEIAKSSYLAPFLKLSAQGNRLNFAVMRLFLDGWSSKRRFESNFGLRTDAFF